MEVIKLDQFDFLNEEQIPKDIELPVRNEKEYTKYSIDSFIKEMKETGSNRLVCPLCKIERESQGVVDYQTRNLQVYEESKTAYCFRCNTIFHDKVDGEKTIKTKTIYEFEKFQVAKIDCSIIEERLLEQSAVEYIQNRCKYYTYELIKKSGIKGNGKAIIIPFYLFNKPYYYQIRYPKPKITQERPKGLKYFNPPISHKPIYFHNFNPNKETIICEGTFDVLAVMSVIDLNKYNVIGIMGSSITQYQVDFLKYLGGTSKIIIFLDDMQKSKDLASMIRKKGYKENIEIIRTFYDEDPEELLNRLGKVDFLSYFTYNRDKIKNTWKRTVNWSF